MAYGPIAGLPATSLIFLYTINNPDANLPCSEGGIIAVGRAAVLLALALVMGAVLLTTITIRSDARADITNYFTGFGWRAPNSFEPGRHDVQGTASEIVANRTANWTVFRNLGNVGIGNGSVATFGDPNSLPSNYSDNYFQAGDVSQEPLDPARELNLNVVAPAAGENITTAAENAPNATVDTGAVAGNSSWNRSLSMPDYFSRRDTSLSADNNVSQPVVNVTAGEAANNTTVESVSPVPSSATPENKTFAAYHPIWAGQPVNDLLYEHPFASSISTYCRLVGLATPSGPPINIGMRCLSYGY